MLLTCWLEQVWKLVAGQRAVPSDLKQHDAHSSALLERIATCDEATFESSVCAAGPLFFTFDGSDGVYVCRISHPRVHIGTRACSPTASLLPCAASFVHCGQKA